MDAMPKLQQAEKTLEQEGAIAVAIETNDLDIRPFTTRGRSFEAEKSWGSAVAEPILHKHGFTTICLG